MEPPIDTATHPMTSPMPAQPHVLNRQVDLEISLDHLWSLVSEAENLQDWLGESIDLDMSPGAVGTVADNGVVRHVRVDRVVDRSRLEFTWWPADQPSEPSRVVFQIEALPSGSSRLDITETLYSTAGHGHADGRATELKTASAELTRADRWEIRVLSLWACTVAMALVQ